MARRAEAPLGERGAEQPHGVPVFRENDVFAGIGQFRRQIDTQQFRVVGRRRAAAGQLACGALKFFTGANLSS